MAPLGGTLRQTAGNGYERLSPTQKRRRGDRHGGIIEILRNPSDDELLPILRAYAESCEGVVHDLEPVAPFWAALGIGPPDPDREAGAAELRRLHPLPDTALLGLWRSDELRRALVVVTCLRCPRPNVVHEPICFAWRRTS